MEEQKRQFWVILIIVFFGFVGISMPYLIFPALFLNPAYSILPEAWGTSSRALFLGMTLAAYPLGQFIGSPILGSLSDDYGRKRLLSGSLLITATCNLLTGLLEFGLIFRLEGERGKIGRNRTSEPIYAVYWRRGGCDPMKPQPHIEAKN